MKGIFTVFLIIIFTGCASYKAKSSADFPGLRDQAVSALKKYIKINYACDEVTVLKITTHNKSRHSTFFERWKIRHCDNVTEQILVFMPANSEKDNSKLNSSYTVGVVLPPKNKLSK